MNEIKITGTKESVDIEYNGNIAQFGGELGMNCFIAKVNSMRWIKHRGNAVEEDKIRLIYNVSKYESKQKFKVIFEDGNGNELKLASLETFLQNSQRLRIEDKARIDSDVANATNHLKPECGKNGREKFCEGCKKAGGWRKGHWKEILAVFAIAIVIVAILAIAVVICTG